MSSQSQKKYFDASDARTLINMYGFALFPIHGIVDGKCTCGNPDCANAGKHPATINGLKDATKDMARLTELWAGRKGLNVGIATGAVSGVFVIDIDGEEGERELNSHGQLPDTLAATTGRGKHLYFKHPGIQIKTRRGVIGSKVDVRGDGGYVAGPGSNHSTGAIYQWINPLETIAPAPQWLIDLVTKDSAPRGLELSAPLPRLSLINNQWSEADAIEMLSHISPDIGYDEWIKVGMALQAEGFGLHVWDQWSRGSSSKYNQAAMPMHWRSFKPNAGVSFGTLVKMAQDGGWKRSNGQNSIIKDTKQTQNDIIYDTKSQAAPNIVEQKQPINPLKLPVDYIMAHNILPAKDSNDFVKGLLGENQLSVIYGESNCGKTFFMTDLCFHIALGRAWRGRRVSQGGIIYTALEGSYGLRNRVEAFRLKHGLDGALFAMVASQIDFMNPDGNIDLFIDCIKRATDEMGSCKMVVVDTLSRAMAGGDENSGQDMGMLVHHADRIRYETGAHVSFVHHSGKNKALGARGHSSLRAAVDTEIEISRDEGADYSSIKVAKQREMEMGEDMYFGLERVVIGSNGFMEEITSCVVKPLEAGEIEAPQQDKKLTPMQQFVYDAIVNSIAISGKIRIPREGAGSVPTITYSQLGQELENRGFKEMVDEDKDAKKVTNNIRIALNKMGKIEFNGAYIWLSEK